jgi:hypothetical protein
VTGLGQERRELVLITYYNYIKYNPKGTLYNTLLYLTFLIELTITINILPEALNISHSDEIRDQMAFYHYDLLSRIFFAEG